MYTTEQMLRKLVHMGRGIKVIFHIDQSYQDCAQESSNLHITHTIFYMVITVILYCTLSTTKTRVTVLCLNNLGLSILLKDTSTCGLEEHVQGHFNMWIGPIQSIGWAHPIDGQPALPLSHSRAANFTQWPNDGTTTSVSVTWCHWAQKYFFL